jgi:NlpC/P60 family putative phage cell wall peptidase
MNANEFGARIVAVARAWIGTPYRHQASVKGIGCDCLGLVRGVWRETVGPEPEDLPPYTRDWGEVAGAEYVLRLANSHMIAISPGQARAGDLVVFRWRAGAVAKHLGILTGPSRFIHAWEHGGVSEVNIGPAWSRRMAAVFRFPQS